MLPALPPVLALLAVVVAPHPAPTAPSGAVLSFGSARDGGVFREPRVEIVRPKLDLAAGDVLEYQLSAPSGQADALGVEVVTSDGRRAGSVAVAGSTEWMTVRVPLDALAGAAVDRVELVARGHLADELAFQVDEVSIVHATGEPTSIFHDALPAGARALRDDERGAGVRVLDASSGFEIAGTDGSNGPRARFSGPSIVEPWNAYDLARLRASPDSTTAIAGGPRGDVLVGPAIPMHFAPTGSGGERAAVVANAQRLGFDPIDGGRFFSVFLAVSTSDGESATARAFACGDAGERLPIDFVVPPRGARVAGAMDLGGCALIELIVASSVPLRAFELPKDPRVLVHAVTFAWRKDALIDPRFRLAWFDVQARASRDLAPSLRAQLARYVANRRLGTIFTAGSSAVESEVEEERSTFEALLRGALPAVEGKLTRALATQAARGADLKGLGIAIDDPIDTRDALDVCAVDAESLLRRLASGLQHQALVLNGDPAEARQLPQFLTASQVDTVILPANADGAPPAPSLSRWSGPDGSSVYAVTPTRTVRDAREFGDLPWREWLERARGNGVDSKLFLAVGASARERAEAQAILTAFAAIDVVPRIRRANVETFVAEAVRRVKTGLPEAALSTLRPLPSESSAGDASETAWHARRAAQAIRQLETFHASAFLDGAPSIADRIADLWRASARIDGANGSAASRSEADALVGSAHELLADQLGVLARGASTVGQGTPIVVFNSLPYERSGLLRLETASAVLISSSGAKLPSQTTWDGARVFVVDVPAFGYEVVHGLQGDEEVAPRVPTGLVVDGRTARNAHLEFTLDAASGAVTSLVMLPDRTEMLAAPIMFLDETWRVRSAEFVERGPLRAVARVTAQRIVSGGNGAEIVTDASAGTADIELVLEASSKSLDVSCRVVARDATPIAARLSIRRAVPRALVGVPFGSAFATPSTSGAPARHRLFDWIAAFDGERGVAILGDACAVVRVERKAMAIETTRPDASGASVTNFALLPYANGWKSAGLAAETLAFDTPLVPVATDVHAGARAARHSFAGVAKLGADGRMIGGPKCGVVLSSLQPSAQGDTWRLRLVETTGLAQDLVISIERPLFGAEWLDLHGNKAGAVCVEDGRVRFTIGPSRVETLQLRLKP